MTETAPTRMAAQVMSLLGPDERELLRRCAVPRFFDHRLIDTILMPTAPPQLLDSLLEDGFVERARAHGNGYRLPRTLRAAALMAWDDEPDELARLRRALAEHWQDERPEEALYSLIDVDPAAAANLFRSRFGEFEARSDLAGCETVLGVLDQRLAALPDELRDLRDEHRVRLARRVQWADDWQRTARFLERPGVTAQFERLLSANGPSVMQLRARGGMGKSMHLRWLIARHCVPRGIPCARIDFDLVVAPTALEEPWLVLLALAEQLNRQLAGTPMTDVLTAESAAQLPRLWLRPPPGSQAVGAGLRGPGASRDETTRHRLERALNRLERDTPVVLVLDTLELAVMRSGASLAPLVGELRRLREACAAVRLIFAGRYDLSERLPDHGGLFETELELHGFSADESARYLTQVRGFDDPALVDVIARRSDGSPFKLALIADILADAGGVTAEDLAAYEQVDLVYLLDRVVLRIPETEVRWVLRYGAIPRALDRDFLERVMMPVLAVEMPRRGEARPLDDPDAGLPQRAADAWPASAPPAGAEAVWSALTHYAEQASWVMPVDGSTVRFHPDVLQPMRRLVAGNEIHRALHERAAAYFRERADRERREWVRWTREEIYHRLQADPEAGAELVREHLRAAAGRPADRRAIVEDLLDGRYYAVGELFGEPDDEAGPADTRAQPPPVLVAELLHVAGLLRLDAALRGDARAREAMALAVVRLDQVQRATGEVVADERIVLLRAALDLSVPGDAAENRDAARARWERRLRAAITRLDDPYESTQTTMLLADLVAPRSPSEAETLIRQGIAIARTQPILTLNRMPFQRRLVEQLIRRGDFDAAAHELRQARHPVAPQSMEAVRLALQDVRISSYAGRHARAARLAREAARSAQGQAHARMVLWAARAAVAARDPAQAMEHLLQLAAPKRRGADDDGWIWVELTATTAAAWAALGQFAPALDTLDTALDGAESRWPGAVRRLLSVQLDFELRVLRDLKRAELTVERSRALAAGAEDFSGVVLRLQRAEWLAARGEPGAARSALGEEIERLERLGGPRGHHVRAALEGLAIDAPDHTEWHLERLVAHLEATRPATARLAQLRELVRAAPVRQESRAAGRLRRLAVQALSGKSLSDITEAGDRTLMQLAAAEVARIARGDSEAAHVLEGIPSTTPVLDADWVEAAARTGLAGRTDMLAGDRLERIVASEPDLAGRPALAVARARLARPSSRGFEIRAALALARKAIAGKPAVVWGAAAELAELEAIYAARVGDGAAERQRAEAIRLYTRLGDAPAIQRTSAGGEPGDLSGRDVRVRSARLPPAALTLLDRDPGEAVPWALVEHAADDWPRLAALMRDSLLALIGPGGFAGRGEHVRLVATDPAVQALPWELALAAPGDAPSSLSRGLGFQEEGPLLERLLAAEGWVGPGAASVEALVERWGEQRRAGPGVGPRACVVSPAQEYEDAAFRGSVDWVMEAGRAYASAGFYAERLELAEPGEIAKLSGDDPTALVHISAGFADAGGAGIDLAGAGVSRALGLKAGRAGAMHAQAFARLPLFAKDPRPVLVLEVPPAGNELELGVQLCLRNEFASAIFDLRACDTIFCAGLLDGAARGEWYRVLATALGAGLGAAAAFDATREHMRGFVRESGRAQQQLAAASFALLATHPGVPAPYTPRPS